MTPQILISTLGSFDEIRQDSATQLIEEVEWKLLNSNNKPLEAKSFMLSMVFYDGSRERK
jgi:hypothetical protein